MPFSEKLLRETIQVWQPCSPEPLTLADAEEICRNVTGLFTVLRKIDERLKRAKMTDGEMNKGDAENERSTARLIS